MNGATMRLSDTRFSDGRKSVFGLITFIASALVIAFDLKTYVAQGHASLFGGPGGFLSLSFAANVFLVLLLLVAASVVERTVLGQAMQRALGHVMEPVTLNADRLIRGACGLFFVALWARGSLILTPGLTTASSLVPLVQLGIAFCMLWRETLVIAAAGIVGLLGLALHDFGSLHLVDGPIFLAIAAYLVMSGLDLTTVSFRPLDAARWVTALTLMWASVERFAYPELSSPLFGANPAVMMGFDPQVFARGAGIVEFALAFALLWTPLCRRVSGLILAGLVLGAMIKLGKADGIFDLPLFAIVLAIASDAARSRLPRRSLV